MAKQCVPNFIKRLLPVVAQFKGTAGDCQLSIPFNLARPPQRLAWFCSGMLSVFKYLSAVDENVLHSDRVLVGILERRAVGDRRRIEYHNVREHSRFEKAAMIQTYSVFDLRVQAIA